MNKLLTTLTLIFASFAWASAQSLTLLEKDGDPAQALYTYYLDGTISKDYKFMVVNLTNKYITYKIKKIVNQVPTSCTPNEIEFCDAILCYTNATTSSNNNITPFDTIGNEGIGAYGLKVTMKSGTCSGLYKVTFKLENQADLADTTTVSFEFNIGVGINEHVLASAKSNFFPNPCADKATLSYELQHVSHKAELRITNLLGEVVEVQTLKKDSDKVELDFSKRSPGLYFYSIVIDGVVAETKRFVVR